MSADRLSVKVRWMIRRDMEAVLRIEKECFDYPWSRGDFEATLRQRNSIGIVAETEDHQVAGFVVYSLEKGRVILDSFAVSKDFRWSGVGAQMLDYLKSKLSPCRRTEIVALVRETNLPAQFFFKRLGFFAVGILRGYYGETREDAYRFRFSVSDPLPATVNRITYLLQRRG